MRLLWPLWSSRVPAAFYHPAGMQRADCTPSLTTRHLKGRLRRLLQPRSIALFGRAPCAQVIRQCRQIGFEGDLWPVHPSLPELEGHRVYPSIDALPGAPDAAFVAVNREATVQVVAELARRGAGGAVCYASGFAESGAAGERLQRQLTRAAAGMAVMGPNCHGFLNCLDGVALWPEPHGAVRSGHGVALLTQSGNIALNLTMQTRALPLAYVVTLGNQADIALGDALEALLEDDRVTAIGLHVEGLADPARFFRAASQARVRRIPIIVLKSGRCELSAQLAVGHTASLAAADDVADSFFTRCGVVRVQTLPALLETLKLVHVHGPLSGRDIASMSSSGGEAGLVADAAAARRLRFPAFTPAQSQQLTAALPALAQPTNPLDYHNFNWGDEVALTSIYAAVMEAGFDLTLLVLDFPRADRCSGAGFDSAVGALCAASVRSGARAALVSTLPETLPEARARALMQAGIAPLCGLEDALSAIDAAARLQELWQSPAQEPFLHTAVAADPERLLSEWESKRALAACGLTIPRGLRVATASQATAAAATIGYPVAVKSVGRDIAHKTEIGAVQLNLADASAVHAAAVQQLTRHGAQLLVEEMIDDAVAELIIGLGRDPVFGLYLLIGSGGVLAELVRDRRILLLPAAGADIAAAIDSLAAGALLRGYRARAIGDIEAAVEAVLAMQRFALQAPERLLELDINPLLVRPRGHGAVAADAMIRSAAGEDS
jgi:acetate---CoA ligase (ADP-forming)